MVSDELRVTSVLRCMFPIWPKWVLGKHAGRARAGSGAYPSPQVMDIEGIGVYGIGANRVRS